MIHELLHENLHQKKGEILLCSVGLISDMITANEKWMAAKIIIIKDPTLRTIKS